MYVLAPDLATLEATMREEILVSLDRRVRITLDNFWYSVEVRDGLGRFKPFGKCRSLEGAIVGFNFWFGDGHELSVKH